MATSTSTSVSISGMNIWSDEIPLDHYQHWLKTERFSGDKKRAAWHLEQVESFVKGQAFSIMSLNSGSYKWWDFPRVKFSTNLGQLLEEVDALHNYTSRWADNPRSAIKELMQYKKLHYPLLLQKRWIHAFLASTKHPESTSAVLGGQTKEFKGVLKLILAFAVDKKQG